MADVVSNTRGGHNFYNRHYWKSFKIFEWGTLFTNRCERLKSRPTSLCWWTSQKGSKILGARKFWMHCPFREMGKRTLVPMTPTTNQREGLIQTDLPFLRKKAPRDWAKNQKSQERELSAFRVRLNTSEISFYWNQYVFGSIVPTVPVMDMYRMHLKFSFVSVLQPGNETQLPAPTWNWRRRLPRLEGHWLSEMTHDMGMKRDHLTKCVRIDLECPRG